jgi:hypothetical protein
MDPFGIPNHQISPERVLCGGTNGPRLWTGQSATWAHERRLPCVAPDGPRWRRVVFRLAKI